MKTEELAPVRFVEDGGYVMDEAGNEHFISGYGFGRHNMPDLDPRIDLTKPIWAQAQRLAGRSPRSLSRRKEKMFAETNKALQELETKTKATDTVTGQTL